MKKRLTGGYATWVGPYGAVLRSESGETVMLVGTVETEPPGWVTAIILELPAFSTWWTGSRGDTLPSFPYFDSHWERIA